MKSRGPANAAVHNESGDSSQAEILASAPIGAVTKVKLTSVEYGSSPKRAALKPKFQLITWNASESPG